LSEILAGRYRLIEEVGTGGMATVWRAWDEELARWVAVKRLRAMLANDEPIAKRFRREAQTVARLSHPNIVTVHDWGIDEGSAYLVMEIVEGHSLSMALRDGPLGYRRALAIATDVLSALEYAHAQGVVHRDIKPGNILVGDDGRIKVADFGIAKSVTDSTLTVTGQVLATPAYAAPEQMRGQGVTPRSDIYAVGCLLFECLTGEPPFRGDDPIALALQHLNDPPKAIPNHAAPQAVASCVLRAMEKDPERRFPSAKDMRDRLLAAAAVEVESGAPPATERIPPESAETLVLRPPPRVEARPRLHPAVVVGAALLAVLIGGMAVMASIGGDSSSGANRTQPVAADRTPAENSLAPETPAAQTESGRGSDVADYRRYRSEIRAAYDSYVTARNKLWDYNAGSKAQDDADEFEHVFFFASEERRAIANDLDSLTPPSGYGERHRRLISLLRQVADEVHQVGDVAYLVCYRSQPGCGRPRTVKHHSRYAAYLVDAQSLGDRIVSSMKDMISSLSDQIDGD
jgi:serine/threonine protein kinase